MDFIEELEEFFGLIRPHPSVVAAGHAPAPKPKFTSTIIKAPAGPVTHIGAPQDAIPLESLTFIEDEEDGSPAYYAKHYIHWEWPEGVSGPTCGVGYDCGYVTRDELTKDWQGIVDDETLTNMLKAVDLRGAAAQSFVSAHRREITVTWDQAITEFTEREVPKWMARCAAVLPNFNALPGLCKGAIFSLTYNRGTGGYHDPSPRYAEMRAIRSAMAESNFDVIPSLISSMKRLWPPAGTDLWNRRLHEAALFQKGLDQAKQPEAVAA